MAISTYFSASLQFRSKKYRKLMFEATLDMVALSFFSRPFNVQIAFSISFFFKQAIALKISTSDSTSGQDEVFKLSRIQSQALMISFSITGAINLAELMIIRISSFLLAFDYYFNLSFFRITSSFSSFSGSYYSSSMGFLIMLVKQSFIRSLSPVAQRQMIRLQAVLWSGVPLSTCSYEEMAFWNSPILTQAWPIFLVILKRISFEVAGSISSAILYILMAAEYFCWQQQIFPMFTLILPANWYCFPLIIQLYLASASWSMPLAYKHRAWLRDTAKDKSWLMRSAIFPFYLCFLKFFSLFTTYLAFSSASGKLPSIFKAADSSRSVLISFYSFLKFSSGLLVFFLFNSSLYLVPSSYLAFF